MIVVVLVPQALPAGAEACISYGCVAKSSEQLMKDCKWKALAARAVSKLE